MITLASARPAQAGDYRRCGIRVASLNASGHLWRGGSVPNAAALTNRSRGTSLASPNPPLSSNVGHHKSNSVFNGSFLVCVFSFRGGASFSVSSRQKKTPVGVFVFSLSAVQGFRFHRGK